MGINLKDGELCEEIARSGTRSRRGGIEKGEGRLAVRHWRKGREFG
jgi:hypothetical protein